MELTYTHCAGLDVHKKTVVACCITPLIKGEVNIVTRSFSTITEGLLELSDWLHSQNVQQVAMESTGEYWKPVYNLLESGFEVLVVNAQHMKNVPGRNVTKKSWGSWGGWGSRGRKEEFLVSIATLITVNTFIICLPQHPPLP